VVDAKRRMRIMANHSATHLLNQSLRNVLGGHVLQQGSSVNDSTLRFDFNNYRNPTTEEILKIEKLVKEAIARGYDVHTVLTSVNEAKAQGAQAVFGEKYGSVVRLVDMDYSKELCGGTHVKNTRDIVDFAIVGVEAKGSGLFRVEAVTKEKIADSMRKAAANINQEIEILLTKGHNIMQEGKNKGMNLAFDFQPDDTVEPSYAYILQKRNELESLKVMIKDLEKTYEAMVRERGSKDYTKYLDMAENIRDIKVLVARVDGIELNILKDLTDKIASHYDKAVIVFVDVLADHLTFIAKAKGNEANCGELVKMAAVFTGGNGGGRRDFAQAGGKDLSKADEVVLRLKAAIKEQL
jgi:alanyl-tRNA synthetase